MAWVCRGATGALVLGSPTRALNELVSEERERVIELLAALTASSDVVEQQRCQILDLKHALQARVSTCMLPNPMPKHLHAAKANAAKATACCQTQCCQSNCMLPNPMLPKHLPAAKANAVCINGHTVWSCRQLCDGVCILEDWHVWL
jgi:hypothetical protein